MQSLTASANCLDDQVVLGRRANAVVRLRKYAGTENGFRAYAALLKQRTIEADGAGRDLSIEVEDGNRARSERERYRRHCRALRELSSDRMGTGVCNVESRTGRL